MSTALRNKVFCKKSTHHRDGRILVNFICLLYNLVIDRLCVVLRLCGADSCDTWKREARRIIPILPRARPITGKLSPSVHIGFSWYPDLDPGFAILLKV
jgi:hypothetical protein